MNAQEIQQREQIVYRDDYQSKKQIKLLQNEILQLVLNQNNPKLQDLEI